MNTDFSFINALESISSTIMKYKAESINSLNANITLSHCVYLEIINKLSEPTFSEIAERLNVSKPAVTIAINNLINAGFVAKLQMDKDKRIYRLRLTDKGIDVVNLFKSAHARFLDNVKGKLSEQEYQQIVDLLMKII